MSQITDEGTDMGTTASVTKAEGQAIEAIQEALAELSGGVHLTNEDGDNVAVSVPIENWREAIAHLKSVLPRDIVSVR